MNRPGASSRTDAPVPVTLPAGTPWCAAGRRLAWCGQGDGAVALRAADGTVLARAALPPAPVRCEPDRVVTLAAGGGIVWATALEHGVAVAVAEAATEWRISAADRPVQGDGGWRAGLPDGRLLLLRLPGGAPPARRGGAWTFDAGPGEVVAAAGRDAAELDRAVAWLARREPSGLFAQRTQHARLLRDYGTALEVPGVSPPAFEWARIRADAGVSADPGECRLPPAVRCRLGAALLAAGNREAARLLLARPDRELLPLAAAWLAWTGDAARLVALGWDPAALDAPAGGATGLPFPDPAAARDVPGDGPGDAAGDVVARLAAAGDPAPAASLAADVLLGTLARTWCPVPDGKGGVSLRAPAGGGVLRRLRVGGAAVDAEARRRFDTLTVRLRRAHGGRLSVTVLPPPGPLPVAILADGVLLAGGAATLEVSAEHEVAFHF